MELKVTEHKQAKSMCWGGHLIPVWSHTRELVFPGVKAPIKLLSGLPQGIRKITSRSVCPPAPGTVDGKDTKDSRRQNKVLTMS